MDGAGVERAGRVQLGELRVGKGNDGCAGQRVVGQICRPMFRSSAQTHALDPLRRARPVHRIGVVVLPMRVVEDGEHAHHLRVGPGTGRQQQPVVAHSPPMGDAVHSPRVHVEARNMVERGGEQRLFSDFILRHLP
ncbi:MAG: hypothetical protein DWI09_11660 [Planctomycetota bacterium]|nr:MAG: hypothetical protein DWI09_11660 [Planctomycetota bacterium]